MPGSESASGSEGDEDTKLEPDLDDSVEINGVPAKKKQKRNKPTLSCSECVERKTKCDRLRPVCTACIKRNTSCTYSQVANLIASTNGSAGRTTKHRKNKQSIGSINTSTIPSPSGLPTPLTHPRSASVSSAHSSPFLLSNVPHTKQHSASVFSISAEHPFANYWTTQGGVPEVIGVLPSKEHADLLVAKYFESCDPIYPMVNRQQFCAEYDRFWSMSQSEKYRVDASTLSLHFAVYALGAQFIQMESEQQKAQIAEFYVSAAHQSLRLVPFLSRTSLKSIQAMVLVGYFLMNDNKAADAWAFLGILTRQAHAMGLNRDPDIIAPHLRPLEKHSRRKVWQAIHLQDTFLTVLLKLPPTTTCADVTVHSLTEEPIDPSLSTLAQAAAEISMPVRISTPNPMSISAIAPPPQPAQLVTTPGGTLLTSSNDISYIRSMWHLADLVQSTVCKPRALSQPMSPTPKAKVDLLAAYHTLYRTLPPPLTTISGPSFAHLALADPRQARQNLVMRANFWHCVMLIEADEYPAGGVKCDVRGALEAGRIALATFFDFWDCLRMDAGVWWVFQHRAFEEALTMATLLSSAHVSTHIPSSLAAEQAFDALIRDSKEDVRRALDILEHVGSSAPEMQKTRTEVLRQAFESFE